MQIVTVYLTEESLDDIGEEDYLLDCLMKELGNQYNTRKQTVIKSLYAYITQRERLFDEDKGVSMYGTNAFNMVWEKACATVFDNKLDEKYTLKDIMEAVGKPLASEYKEDMGLSEIIEKPIWSPEDDAQYWGVPQRRQRE